MSTLAATSVRGSVPHGVQCAVCPMVGGGVERTSLVVDAWRLYVRQGGRQHPQPSTSYLWEEEANGGMAMTLETKSSMTMYKCV